MNVNIQVSIAEFFDKLTILEIKRERIEDAEKRKNVVKELEYLESLLESLPFSRSSVQREVEELRAINEALWAIEDEIRLKEAQESFDARFIELARSVYINNDRRAAVKRAINLKLGSDFVEEKSYQGY